MPKDLMKLVASVLAQKRALGLKEQQLIASLNRVLPDMGYQVVPAADGGKAARRRPGRPLGSSARPAGSAPKRLVCAQCGRRFSHPLHLGRHTSAMHKTSGSKPATKASPRKVRRRKRARKATRATAS